MPGNRPASLRRQEGWAPPDRDDAELLTAVGSGDTGALRTLDERHAPWVSVRLTRRCNDPDAVADVLQVAGEPPWAAARPTRTPVAGWPSTGRST